MEEERAFRDSVDRCFRGQSESCVESDLVDLRDLEMPAPAVSEAGGLPAGISLG